MGTGKSLCIGFLTGTAVGVAAARLSTSETGKNMFTYASQQGTRIKETLNRLKDSSLKLSNLLTKSSKDGAVLAKELTREMKNSVDEWKTTVEPHQETIQEYLEQIESGIKDLEDKMRE